MKKSNTIDQKILETITSQLKNQQSIEVESPLGKLRSTPQHKKYQQQMQIDDNLLKIFDLMSCMPFLKRFIEIYFKDSGILSYYKFMKSLRYVKVNKGAQVLKQGDQMNRNIYILLTGTVIEAKKNQSVFTENITRTGVREQFEIKQYANNIHNKSKDNKDQYLEGDEIVKLLNELGPEFREIEIGESSGEDVLYEKGPRTCSLFAVTDAEFVMFNKNSFWKIQTSNNQQKQKLKELVKIAININYAIYNQNTISQIISSFQLENIQKDEFIFQEGQINDKVFIIQGSCEVSMSYTIKKNVQQYIQRDLKGTFIIDNLTIIPLSLVPRTKQKLYMQFEELPVKIQQTRFQFYSLQYIDGVFFMGDEIVFDSWKKYKYSLRVTARNTQVYSCKFKDIEDNYDQITLNHMKESYLKKMVMYSRKYEKNIQDIIQENKKKIGINKNMDTTNQRKNSENQSQQTDSKKQKTLKNFLSPQTGKGDKINLTQFLKQDGKQKNSFQEILSQVQKDKFQTRVLEQNTITINCCFQMQQPIYYTYSKHLTIQPEDTPQVQQNYDQQTNNQMKKSLFNQTIPTQETSQTNIIEKNKENKQEGETINNYHTIQYEQEDWLSTQNNKNYIKKSQQKETTQNSERLQQNTTRSSFSLITDPLCKNNTLLSSQTEISKNDFSKLFTGESRSQPQHSKSITKQHSFQECSLEEDNISVQEENIQNIKHERKQSDQMNSFQNFQFYQTQQKMFRNKTEDFYSKTLSNFKKRSSKNELIPTTPSVQNKQTNNFNYLIDLYKLQTLKTEQSDKQIKSNTIQNINCSSQSSSTGFKNNLNKSKYLNNQDEDNQIQKQGFYSFYNCPYSFITEDTFMEKRKNSQNLNNSFCFENQNIIDYFQSTLEQNQINPLYSNPQRRIKKGLVLSRSNRTSSSSPKSLSGFKTTKQSRIHDTSTNSLNKNYGIKLKKKYNQQKYQTQIISQ